MVGGDGREDGMDGYPDIGSRSRGKGDAAVLIDALLKEL